MYLVYMNGETMDNPRPVALFILKSDADSYAAQMSATADAYKYTVEFRGDINLYTVAS